MITFEKYHSFFHYYKLFLTALCYLRIYRQFINNLNFKCRLYTPLRIEEGKRTSTDYRRSIALRLSYEMELLEERYYKLNRIFLSATGLWPYDNFKFRRFRFILLLSLLISFTGSQVFALLCNVHL